MENKEEIFPNGGNFLILLLIMILIIAFLCIFFGSYFFGIALIILLVLIALFFCFFPVWKRCCEAYGQFKQTTLEHFSFSDSDRKMVEKHLSKTKYRALKR